MAAKTDVTPAPPGKDLQVMMQVIGLLQSLAGLDSDPDDVTGSLERVLRSVNAFFGHKDVIEDLERRLDDIEQQLITDRKGGL